MMDNFYVEKPVFMVDLGRKTTVSGVIIYTWSGDASGWLLVFPIFTYKKIPKF